MSTAHSFEMQHPIRHACTSVIRTGHDKSLITRSFHLCKPFCKNSAVQVIIRSALRGYLNNRTCLSTIRSSLWDFKLVLLAIVLAIPLSTSLRNNGSTISLTRYPSSGGIFVGAGVAALSIAWLTVGTQAVRASHINPTQCLRDE